MAKAVVTLKLQSGESFYGVSLGAEDKTLAEFLDCALKDLEGESRIQLPDTEADLVDASHFKVLNEEQTIELDLAVQVGQQPYIAHCLENEETPVLYLVSEIFKNALQVERERHVADVIRRTTVSGQNPRAVEDAPPSAAERSASLTAKTISKDAVLFMAGCKEGTPVGSRLRRVPSPSTTSLASSATSVGYEGDIMGIFGSSISLSDDTGSIHSSTSTCTEQSFTTEGRWTNAPVGHNRPGSAPSRKIVHRGSDVSTQSELGNHPRQHSADGSNDLDIRLLGIGSVSGGGPGVRRVPSPRSSLLLSQSATSPTKQENPSLDSAAVAAADSKPAHSHRQHRAISPPPRLVEELTDSTQLASIDEDTTLSNLTRSISPTGRGRRSSSPSNDRRGRELSPELIVRPVSPDGVSPGVSPSGSPLFKKRKTRLASKRKRIGSSSSTASNETVDGAAEESHLVLQHSSTQRNRRTIYDRSTRHSTFFPIPMRVFGKIKTFQVDFEFPIMDVVVAMEIRGDHTIAQIRENLWTTLKDQEVVMEYDTLDDPEGYTFTYEMNGDKYELYDDQQIFQTAGMIQQWRREKREKGLLVVEQKPSETKEEKTMNMEISAMIGIGLYQLQFANNDELDITRRQMVSVRKNAVNSRNTFNYSMEMDMTTEATPPHVLEQIREDKILVRVYYKVGSYQTCLVDVHDTAAELLSRVFPMKEEKKDIYGIPLDSDISDYVLKVAGLESFLHGNNEIIQFAHVVRCLSKRQDIELALVKQNDQSKDLPRDIPDWNLIDDATGLTGTHNDLSALSKEHTQVFTMSMWDIQRKFRIRVVGLDNLRCPDVEVVYVEAGLYHGGEILGVEKFTTEVSASTYPRWNQWLLFDVAVKNLPKAARLSIQVVGGTRVKDTKKKSLKGRRSLGKDDKKSSAYLDRPLHWVNMQVLDHRSILRQGVLRLNLWPIVASAPNNQGGSHLSPMGSTAINPDGNNSAVLYVELDNYAHPVACPTGGWGEDVPIAPEPSTKERSVFRRDLEGIIHADPLKQMDKAEKELIWKFRAHCSTVPEALPKLLRCVDWGNLEQVCEVHRLLKVWRPVTLDVALELLDYHFADEKVRSLAVRRLERLANEELLNFLLQLIQVLKFEPYHDSALAQFLLKRALQSKRIGHFFYWYLRSEMDTPEFNQRFGILLEGYLRGCGEEMFKQIRSQHKAMCDIMDVAASIKKQLDRYKGATELAKELLAKYQLPDSFSPPYDPMLRMGRLEIAKCRVMDSKKAPLWLEFQNMDPSAVHKRPIKVIAKHGDDLRQDMLTLQMLSLMDKMWQAHGLDLFIISYGCIATGNNRGMIQVVQEAETVAKIQLNHGGTFSALKEEPLHDWLRKQNPTQNRFEAAVEKFMLSCAGYCVATYILGIGDRHNDNIMVTTSGNLFHIDFGHFLGNKKEFLGVNRERSPFVLTPDFEYVMGKKNSVTFHRFEDTAVKAYLIIRKNANRLINLFSMMKCTGIPELRSVEDIEYLRGVLVLDKNEQQAADHFKAQIQLCLKQAWSTQLNWFSHILAHSRT